MSPGCRWNSCTSSATRALVLSTWLAISASCTLCTAALRLCAGHTHRDGETTDPPSPLQLWGHWHS